MSENKILIITLLVKYLYDNPNIRFGQALFNLGINQFANRVDPSKKDYLLRDIYNDSDEEILKRVQS